MVMHQKDKKPDRSWRLRDALEQITDTLDDIMKDGVITPEEREQLGNLLNKVKKGYPR